MHKLGYSEGMHCSSDVAECGSLLVGDIKLLLLVLRGLPARPSIDRACLQVVVIGAGVARVPGAIDGVQQHDILHGERHRDGRSQTGAQRICSATGFSRTHEASAAGCRHRGGSSEGRSMMLQGSAGTQLALRGGISSTAGCRLRGST